jgi:hypothetical protein
LTEDGNSIGSITLENNRARITVNNMEKLIDLCRSDPVRNEQYKFATRKYNAAIMVLCQKHNFVDDDMYNFQSNIDDFFQVQVQLHGHVGFTNYIHLLSSSQRKRRRN